MNQPELKNELACVPLDGMGQGMVDPLFTNKDDMLLRTLEELLKAWLVTMTPIEIGSDPSKIRLLREISREASGDPTPFVRKIYEEVFLQDVWTRADPSESRNAG